MFGKLIKYEFKALSSVLLPIFGAMLVMGILAPVFVSLPDITGGRFFIAQILTVIYIVIYACLLFGGGLMCLIATVIRFRKNLLGDEGYLMHTLPVKKWQLTASKVIAAVSMQLLGGLAAAVSGIIFIAMSVRSAFSGIVELFGLIHYYLPDLGMFGALTIIEGILLVLLALIGLNLMLYASLCVGHSADSHKTLLSVGAFIGFYIISQIISSSVFRLAQVLFGDMLEFNTLTFASMQPSVITAILLYAGYAAAYFAITSFFMKRKLNI